MEEKNIYKLSNNQRNIWLVDQRFSNTNVNNIVGELKFNTKIDIETLKRAVNLLVKKNDALRIKMEYHDGILEQYIEEYKKFDIDVLNINKDKEYLQEFSSYIFNLTKDNLYYFEIIQDDKGKTRLISRFHHIIADAWSLSLVSTEIIDLYNKLTNKIEITDENYYSYFKYIESEKQYINSERYFKDQKYWNEIYEKEPQILSFKNDISKINTKAIRYTKTLNKKISEDIKKFTKENGVSEYCLFLTTLQVYLSKRYNIDDVIIGNPFLNRKNRNEKEAIGIFVNTLPVRLKIDYEISTLELLKINSKTIREALKHEEYPYNDILEYVKDKHSINQNLYNVLFSYQNAKDITEKEQISYSSEWIFHNNIADNIEIHIHDRNDTGAYSIVIDYQNQLFEENEIEKLYQAYENILEQVVKEKIKNVSEIKIISEKEEKYILKKFNNQKLDLSKEYKAQNIIKLIDFKRYKDKIAIETNDKSITYKELEIRVEKLISFLKKNIVIQEKENIGIITDKSIDTLVGILAILKMNCTYVPIDPQYPIKRKEYMIESADVTKVLYSKSDSANFADIKVDISYERYEEEIINNTRDKIKYNINNNLYIIYTSGSTGNPKPVTISHKNMINLIENEIYTKEIKFEKNSKILQFATLSFDVSYQEIFSAFLTGSTLYIIKDEDKKDSNKLLNCITENKIDILFIPPRYLEILTESELVKNNKLPLKHIITAGEQLIITDSIKKVIEDGTIIHNHYGPAETHVATTYTINKNNIEIKPPIGKAIKNVSVYILDKNLNLCPINGMGEIYISGDCVGNGYYNRDELTKERFLDDPFNKENKMYKTGDLGKIDANGNIYYLGRNDFQVKVNGYRIELEEVEKALSKIEIIKKVAVVIEKDTGQKNSIIAFIETKSAITYEKLKIEMIAKLPQYMIPAKIYLLNEMPLNINGKADKKYLRENQDKFKLLSSTDSNILPSNDLEVQILKCMQLVLKTKNITVQNNFFEVGGDSLLAISLQIELAKQNIILNTQEIYDNPSARSLAMYVKRNNNKESKEQFEKIDIKPVQVHMKNKNNILLTGATGFLGVHILNYLVKNTNNTIYCIIRNKKQISAADRIKDVYYKYFNEKIDRYIDKRVIIVEGDLVQEDMGLNDEQYENLRNNIDVIINVAASVKHYGKRDYNFEHNVVSIKNLVAFSKKCDCLLNHISTVGIAGNNLVNTNECYKNTFTESDLKIGQKYSENVYLSTKLQAEIHIIENIQKYGLKANILRVGNLMNRYTDNVFQINKETNAFQNKIKEIIKLGYITKDLEKFTFDITPVDMCAEAVVKLSLNDSYNNVYHVLNNNEISIEQIEKILKKYNIKLGYKDEFLKEDIEKSKWLINDFILNNKEKIEIDSKKTQKVLKTLDFEWKNDTKYYERVIESIVEGGKNEGLV